MRLCTWKYLRTFWHLFWYQPVQDKYETTLQDDLSIFHSGLLEEGGPLYLAYRLRILDKKIIWSIKEHFIQYQKQLNLERQEKFASRTSSDRDNILNALSNLGLDEVVAYFSQNRGAEGTEQECEVSSDDDRTEETGITFIPPEIRNAGLEFSSSSSTDNEEVQ